MTTGTVNTEVFNDAELVAESLAGNRDAFGQIIARYQSLVCSLAYAGGNLGRIVKTDPRRSRFTLKVSSCRRCGRE